MKIKLVRLDEADEAAGFKYGQVFEAVLSQNSGALYYQIKHPYDGDYYFFRADQVEAA